MLFTNFTLLTICLVSEDNHINIPIWDTMTIRLKKKQTNNYVIKKEKVRAFIILM